MTRPIHPSTRDVEQTFLRRCWWVFPVAGALASLALGGPFWNWVNGQPIQVAWERLFSLRALAFAMAFLAIPAIWKLGLAWPWRRRTIGLLALALFVGMECLLRLPLVQASLWLATRARLEPDRHFMREACYVRLEETAGRQAKSPAVFLVGSSQILNGVDVDLLRTRLAPTPVIRRAMFGMTPLKALCMQPFMPFREGDTCLLYLSEFDFTNQATFPFDWFRPYASWQSLPAVMDSVPGVVRWRYWRQITDYALAATLETWRTRDFLQQIVQHAWQAPRVPPPIKSGPDAETLIRSARAELRLMPAEQAAFATFAQRLSARGVRLVIFEGDVNSAIYSASRLEAKAYVREFLQKCAQEGNRRYVSREEQALEFGPEHWSDMSHLNATGRRMLTERMAEVCMDDAENR